MSTLHKMIDREIIACVREAISPLLHVFGHWHLRRSIDVAMPARLERLGMEGARLGNLIVWESLTHAIYGTEVKWGIKR